MRRWLLLGVVVVALVALAATRGSGTQTEPDTPASTPPGSPTSTRAADGELTTLPVAPADSVVEAYGLGVHLPWPDSPYRDAAKVAQALRDLKVRHVRDDLYLDHPRQYAAIRKLAEQGIRFSLIMGRPDRDGTPADYVRTLAEHVPLEAVEAIEGVNEWDVFGEWRDWEREVVAWQEELYAAAKADARTADVPVLSPAMAFPDSYAGLPMLAPYADLANAHIYPGGNRPGHHLAEVTKAVSEKVPDKPLVTTEAGYHNATSTTDDHDPVPEDVAATYMPRLLLEHVRQGHERVYGYELIDSFDDPSRTDPEAHFGLLRHDWSPKPAYDAMKTLLGLLDDPGPRHDTEPLEVRVSGWPGDGRYVATQRRDGTYVLLLWRDVPLWDPSLREPLHVSTTTLDVGLPREFDITVQRIPGTATPTQSRGETVQVELDGAVTAVILR